MKCKKCGNEIQDEAIFCQGCGTPVNNEDVSEACEELLFHKGKMLGRMTYKRINTKVQIKSGNLVIQQSTTKAFRKEVATENIVPISSIRETRVHTIMDLWDTLGGILCIILTFVGEINILMLLVAAVFFWCAYGKEIVLTDNKGNETKIPFEGNTDSANRLEEICTKGN